MCAWTSTREGWGVVKIKRIHTWTLALTYAFINLIHFVCEWLGGMCSRWVWALEFHPLSSAIVCFKYWILWSREKIKEMRMKEAETFQWNLKLLHRHFVIFLRSSPSTFSIFRNFSLHNFRKIMECERAPFSHTWNSQREKRKSKRPKWRKSTTQSIEMYFFG